MGVFFMALNKLMTRTLPGIIKALHASSKAQRKLYSALKLRAEIKEEQMAAKLGINLGDAHRKSMAESLLAMEDLEYKHDMPMKPSSKVEGTAEIREDLLEMLHVLQEHEPHIKSLVFQLLPRFDLDQSGTINGEEIKMLTVGLLFRLQDTMELSKVELRETKEYLTSAIDENETFTGEAFHAWFMQTLQARVRTRGATQDRSAASRTVGSVGIEVV